MAADTPQIGPPSAGAGEAGRIVLQAKSDSWIEVKDSANNSILLARVLRAGDSYRVPDRPSLKLATGNAGGLIVSVDGAALPPLGKEGAVRRGIVLDPDALRSAAHAAN
jgi:cytoskeleton protein RodZ